MKKLILPLLLGLSTALAHTAITSVTPGEGKTVSAPRQVVITFNEPVSLRFSTFKVYPLGVSGDTLSVNRAAAKLAKSVIGLKNDDQARADHRLSGAASTSTVNTSTVTLPLKDHLKSGSYVVMWRILSEDGHPVTGQYVFRVK